MKKGILILSLMGLTIACKGQQKNENGGNTESRTFHNQVAIENGKKLFEQNEKMTGLSKGFMQKIYELKFNDLAEMVFSHSFGIEDNETNRAIKEKAVRELYDYYKKVELRYYPAEFPEKYANPRDIPFTHCIQNPIVFEGADEYAIFENLSSGQSTEEKIRAIVDYLIYDFLSSKFYVIVTRDVDEIIVETITYPALLTQNSRGEIVLEDWRRPVYQTFKLYSDGTLDYINAIDDLMH